MSAKNAIDLLPAVKINATQYWRPATALFRQWLQRRREREELAAMTELELKDIGLVRADLRSLLSAPYWKRHPFADEDKAGMDRHC
jgi:uncharacterized protein YjiS (DUF1127 family)